ncbi:hypothetical protein E2C01_007394 [Portunus trituberculatus]|uniref:Uncharacterized protein n=1 Tax=Portunus trituberculatus TaxID=210409 RepID=A0A5B7D2C1_PORTR|nr:hypothetical protein [Portunus trituberculatus]
MTQWRGGSRGPEWDGDVSTNMGARGAVVLEARSPPHLQGCGGVVCGMIWCVPIKGLGLAGIRGTSNAGHIAGQAVSVVVVVVVKGRGVKNKTESTVHRSRWRVRARHPQQRRGEDCNINTW